MCRDMWFCILSNEGNQSLNMQKAIAGYTVYYLRWFSLFISIQSRKNIT